LRSDMVKPLLFWEFSKKKRSVTIVVQHKLSTNSEAKMALRLDDLRGNIIFR